jgi:hypothetical protein
MHLEAYDEVTPNRQLWKARFSYVRYCPYHDFFMPSRLGEYNELLELLVSKSYVFLTIRDFASLRFSGDQCSRRPHSPCYVMRLLLIVTSKRREQCST